MINYWTLLHLIFHMHFQKNWQDVYKADIFSLSTETSYLSPCWPEQSAWAPSLTSILMLTSSSKVLTFTLTATVLFHACYLFLAILHSPLSRALSYNKFFWVAEYGARLMLILCSPHSWNVSTEYRIWPVTQWRKSSNANSKDIHPTE